MGDKSKVQPQALKRHPKGLYKRGGGSRYVERIILAYVFSFFTGRNGQGTRRLEASDIRCWDVGQLFGAGVRCLILPGTATETDPQ